MIDGVAAARAAFTLTACSVVTPATLFVQVVADEYGQPAALLALINVAETLEAIAELYRDEADRLARPTLELVR